MDGASVDHSGRSLCLLSLDGGGVRGLSSLYILKAIVDGINPEDPPKPCNLFDMIGGTSTGGLIALMLGRLEMTVDECIKAYKAMSPQIFTKLHHRLNLRGKVQGRFDHTAIESAVKDLLRNACLDENTLLHDSKASSTKTFVCATSKQTGRTTLLRSYRQKERLEGSLKSTTIWQAARATSAATSFFDPVEIENEDFVDGATPANNPVMELWAEAWAYFSPEDNATWDLDDNISCLISIGTGVPTVKPFGDDPISIGAKLVKIATDTEKRAEEFARHHPKLHIPQRYFRLNVIRGLEGVGLEDHSKSKEIIGATRLYTESLETSRMLVNCSTSLSQIQQLSANHDIALAHSQDLNFQSVLNNTLLLSRVYDIAPTSEILAWFTNTKPYRNWIGSKGGCLYYPVTHQTTQGFGNTLLGALPASWIKFPPPTFDDPIKVAYVNCSHAEPSSMNDIVRRLVCQALIHFFPAKDTWLNMLAHVRIQERRMIAANFEEANFGKLLSVLRFLLESKQDQVNGTLLCIVNNIHNLNSNNAADEITHLRADLERMGILLLITGKRHLSRTNQDWGASAMASVDEETEYLECLEALKFDDLFTRRNQVSNALAGTNQWLLENESFAAWKNSPAGLLWIQGKPGSGKSVLAKTVLDIASRSIDTAIMASWFYSRRGGTVGMSHDSMMRSVTYRLLDECPSLFKTFCISYRQHGLTRDTFTALLNPPQVGEKSPKSPRMICLLDGLDESEERDGDMARDILGLLAGATERPGSQLKVLVLSRPYKVIQKVYGTYDILLEAENRADIDKIVDSGVESLGRMIDHSSTATFTTFGQARRRRLEGQLDNRLERFSNGPKDVVSENNHKETEAVRQYLKENARGVTLWVTLSIQQILRFVSKGPCTWAAVQRLLRRLPLELDQMYDTIVRELMEDCDQEHMLMARKVLAWVITASTVRPLLLRELMDAMSIPDALTATGLDIDQTSDPIRDNRPIFSTWAGLSDSINDICGPLVEFVNTSGAGIFQYDRQSKVTGSTVVQLVHQTAKDFLEKYQHHTLGFRPEEAKILVRDYGLLYLRLVIPLGEATYAPYLDDVSETWELTVQELLRYLDDKHLLPFVLVYCKDHTKELVLTASSDDEVWRLSAFFRRMKYKDLKIDGVVEKTAVGLLYRLGCNLGMDVAIGNLLFLAALRSGWWMTHRAAVLRAVSGAAGSFGMQNLRNILTKGQKHLNKPALRSDFRDDPHILSLKLTRPSSSMDWADPQAGNSTTGIHPQAGNSTTGIWRPSIPRTPELPQTGDVQKVKMAISRVVHYLLGNLQPVELVGVDFYDEMGRSLWNVGHHQPHPVGPFRGVVGY